VAFVGGFLVMLLIGTIYSHSKLNKLLMAIEATKPGFTEFYRIWRKEKNREATRAALAMGLSAVAGGIAGAVAENNEKARVRRAVDNELNRRGL